MSAARFAKRKKQMHKRNLYTPRPSAQFHAAPPRYQNREVSKVGSDRNYLGKEQMILFWQRWWYAGKTNMLEEWETSWKREQLWIFNSIQKREWYALSRNERPALLAFDSHSSALCNSSSTPANSFITGVEHERPDIRWAWLYDNKNHDEPGYMIIKIRKTRVHG